MTDIKDPDKTEKAVADSADVQKASETSKPVVKEDPWTDEYATESVAPEIKSQSTEGQAQAAESPVAAHRQNEEKPSSKKSGTSEKSDWERDLINRLAFASVNEQRRSRRWSVFFKFAFLVYLIGILVLYFPEDRSEIHLGSHTAMVELSGPIADNSFANANTIISGLRAAFKDKNTKGVIIRINSPGGSPVQAGYINDEIYRLREKYPNIPLYAVISDMCASAAYYIAAGAQEIYADKASIVGSIGVLMDGFGFVDTMKKLGVERRLMTAGENKAFLDPFSPVDKDNQAHMQSVLDNVHQQFISVVKKGRGNRLSADPDIFTGLFWSGDKSVDLGLIDGLGSMGYVAREIIGEEKIVDFTPRPNYLDRFAERIGVAAANSLSTLFLSQGGLK